MPTSRAGWCFRNLHLLLSLGHSPKKSEPTSGRCLSFSLLRDRGALIHIQTCPPGCTSEDTVILGQTAGLSSPMTDTCSIWSEWVESLPQHLAGRVDPCECPHTPPSTCFLNKCPPRVNIIGQCSLILRNKPLTFILERKSHFNQ